MTTTKGWKARLLVLAFVLLIAVAVGNLMYQVGTLPLAEETGAPLVGIGVPIDFSVDQQTSLTISIVLSVLAGGLILVAYWKFRPRSGVFPFRELLPMILLLVILLLMPLLIPPMEELPPEEDNGSLPDGENGEPGGVGETEPGSASRLIPFGPSLLALLMALLAVTAAYALLVMLRRRSTLGPALAMVDAESRQRLVDTLEHGIYRLKLGDDVRKIILECYRDMVDLFRLRGLNVEEHLTAREIESVAAERLGLSSASSGTLRELFEVARYSAHSLSGVHRQGAIDSLRRVREELEAS